MRSANPPAPNTLFVPAAEDLEALREIDHVAIGLDVRPCEEDAVAVARIAEGMRALLVRAIERLHTLQHVDESEPERESDVDDWLTPVVRTRAPQEVADLCFAGAFELRRALKELERATAHDDLVVATESARRKLRRGIRAILATAREGAEAPPSETRYHATDIQAALSVRRLFHDFRRALRRPPNDSPEEVLSALRYAAGALAALFAAPGYADVRASDRRLLRRLHERILSWARQNRPRNLGLELLEDVRTSSDLLRGINCRQELRAHDAALLNVLRRGPSGDPTAFTAGLGALVGLDDTLDGLIRRWLDEPSGDLLAELLNQLAAIE